MSSSEKLPASKVLQNGVIVPARLQINEMSIVDWRNRTTFDPLYRNMTKEDLRLAAQRMGFSPEAIAKEFP